MKFEFIRSFSEVKIAYLFTLSCWNIYVIFSRIQEAIEMSSKEYAWNQYGPQVLNDSQGLQKFFELRNAVTQTSWINWNLEKLKNK